MANLRRTDGLGKNRRRAVARAAQLADIDPDWNCPWPLDWQRHFRVLAGLAADEPGGRLPHIVPGVLYEGDDLGRWIRRQTNAWPELSEEQRERLSGLGVKPAEWSAGAPGVKGGRVSGKVSVAFLRGVHALTQFIVREGHDRVPRAHAEEIVVGGAVEVVRLGVWVSNIRSRRDKLTPEQRAALAELGVEWV